MQNVYPRVTAPNMVQCTVPFTCFFWGEEGIIRWSNGKEEQFMQDEIKISGSSVRQ